MQKPLWKPSKEQINNSNMTAFIKFVAKEYGFPHRNFKALYQWSIEKREEFWQGVWSFCDIKASKKWTEALKDGDKMPGAKWFPGSRLNFAENLLRYRDEKTALVFWGEERIKRSLSYEDLYFQTARLAQSMRETGVKTGDTVVGFLPNLPEAVIAMLAGTSFGAIWSSCSPDFGINGVLDRFGQIQPKIIFSADGYYYGGKKFDCLAKLEKICKKLPSIKKVVVIPYVSENPDLSTIKNSLLWDDFIAGPEVKEIHFEQLPFNYPLYIMYSSGTTGIPKCIVHSSGGTLIQHLKELVLHNDLKREDRIFYFTTCGWMMWNWLVSSLSVGAAVMLYDGSPVYPKMDILFDFAEQEKMTIFGTSAKYISLIEKTGLKPKESHNLSNLKAMLSTGSPLVPESFDYVYRDIKQDIRLSSISGGTDIVSCFALGNPIGAVFRGELQTRGLGMKVEVYDEEGESVINQKGELVCTAPFPAMPIYFWKDDDGSKYRKAYFEHFPGVWRHGDWAQLTESDGMIIYGRSDATLNSGGVRIGTAEIYRSIDQLAEVLESLVIGQEWHKDERIILFVKLRNSLSLTEELEQKIKGKIRLETSPRHVPAKIIQVTDIPRTISGKIVELAVKNIIHNREVKNVDALANPQSLEQFRDLEELKH